ncbi:hypothetical protein LIER_14825 [Lithospermum erythrorhizon]|uniref:Calcineurin-like phosphoesterase domain-containing protein n=1 Tax=Lithospermum erythrorhizon TaxID=34254 RepID=A0AAV3Q2G2_LITER
MPLSVRIAVIGDLHDEWLLEEDAKALQFLKPDLVLFTGDFGNENIELVRTIAGLQMTKAAILGNHDAWRTKRFSEREKDPVQLQLECLGDEHVGFRRLDFPTLKLSVVGGRPFSCGGKDLYRERLLKARYGISKMDESSKRIYHAARGTPDNHSVIFLAHNGPSGLGSNMDDICGRDWIPGGGDHGDPDLENAISQLKQTTRLSVPLVVFGHMHKGLAYGGIRKMIAIRDDGTTYLNGAILPRVWLLGSNQEICSTSSTYNGAGVESHGSCRAFTIAELLDGELAKVTETWVSVVGDKVALEEEHTLFPPIC